MDNSLWNQVILPLDLKNNPLTLFRIRRQAIMLTESYDKMRFHQEEWDAVYNNQVQ